MRFVDKWKDRPGSPRTWIRHGRVTTARALALTVDAPPLFSNTSARQIFVYDLGPLLEKLSVSWGRWNPVGNDSAM